MTSYLNTCKTFIPFVHSYAGEEGHKPINLSPLFTTISAMHRRSRQRQHLKTLEPRLLEDIGLTVAQAEFEYNKFFWEE